MKKFDNAVEAVADKPRIEEYGEMEKKKIRTPKICHVTLNFKPIPNIQKIPDKGTNFYNEKSHGI